MITNSAISSKNLSFELFHSYNSKDEIDLICFVCSNFFKRKKVNLIQNIKRGRQTTCSRSCASKLQSDKYKNKTNVFCSCCKKHFYKKKNLVAKHKNHFCSLVCKNIFNSNKKKKSEIKKTKTISMIGITKGMLFEKRKNWQSARSAIQKHARKVFLESNEKKSCWKCGYFKHYEVCHIKNVSSFPDDVLILEINDIKNLVALCPTHHWEFDNNFLEINK